MKDLHTVTFTTKTPRNVLVETTKAFKTVSEACNFFNEIKWKSATIPVLDTKKGN